MNLLDANADAARRKGHVDGDGITIAVLDTGCFREHLGFLAKGSDQSRVLTGRNFTGVGGESDVTDRVPHGTPISGIIAAKSFAPVIAPAAKILPLKIAATKTDTDFNHVIDALSWLLGDGAQFGASVVCLSIGDVANYQSAGDALAAKPEYPAIAGRIRELRNRRIPTVTAAGNHYRSGGQSKTGMCFPAIMPECLSVGAVYVDESTIGRTYTEYGDATVRLSRSKQIAPFSQRLPRTEGNNHFTRLFSPGAPIKSAGTSSTTSVVTGMHGTSVAVPFVAGIIALLQEWHKKHNQGRLPSCDKLEQWLREGAEDIVDADEGRDNVTHTNATFKLVDALGAITAMIGEVPSA